MRLELFSRLLEEPSPISDFAAFSNEISTNPSTQELTKAIKMERDGRDKLDLFSGLADELSPGIDFTGRNFKWSILPRKERKAAFSTREEHGENTIFDVIINVDQGRVTIERHPASINSGRLFIGIVFTDELFGLKIDRLNFRSPEEPDINIVWDSWHVNSNKGTFVLWIDFICTQWTPKNFNLEWVSYCNDFFIRIIAYHCWSFE